MKTVKTSSPATRNQMAGILYQVRHIETLLQGIFYLKLLLKRYDYCRWKKYFIKSPCSSLFTLTPSKFANIFHQKMSGTYFSLIYSRKVSRKTWYPSHWERLPQLTIHKSETCGKRQSWEMNVQTKFSSRIRYILYMRSIIESVNTNCLKASFTFPF